MHKNLSKAFEAMHAMLYHIVFHLKFFKVTFWYPNLELIVPSIIYNLPNHPHFYGSTVSKYITQQICKAL